MQTDAQSILNHTVPRAPLCYAGEKSIQTFDLAPVVNDFCKWYSRSLADKNLRMITKISPSLPRYVQGNQILLQKMLMDPAKNSLLYAGNGAVAVEIDAKQHTRRRYSLRITLTLSRDTISSIRQEALLQAGAGLSPRDGFRLRSANLYYARMIAERFGGDIRIDSSSEFGLRYLIEVNLFSPLT